MTDTEIPRGTQDTMLIDATGDRAPVVDAWAVRPMPEPCVLEALHAAHNGAVPEIVVRLAAQRGVTTPESLTAWLRPSLAQLAPPQLLKGIDLACQRLRQAFERHERVMVAGDYDVDGVTATAVMMKGLARVGVLTAARGWGMALQAYVPHRLRDGFGLSRNAVDTAIRDGVRLIITVDNGIAAHAAVAYAVANGIDVLITDHHLAPADGPPPDATAVVNPNQPGCAYPTKEISGAVVAWKVLQALMTAIEIPRADRSKTMLGLIDLVTVGLICDVMPLVGENRAIAREGLKRLPQSAHVGLRLLLGISRLGRTRLDALLATPGDPLTVVRELVASGTTNRGATADDCGFGIGPRLNATGRLDDAGLAYATLMEGNALRAWEQVQQLNVLNRERQRMVDVTLTAAVAQLDQQAARRIAAGSAWPPPAIVVHDPSWHVGIVGIVASRLVELLQRPAIVLGRVGEEWKGSGRSPAGTVHLQRALEAPAVQGTLRKAGGHAEAAGLSLMADQLEAFHAAFEAEVQAQRRVLSLEDTPLGIVEIDLEARLADCTRELVSALEIVQPCGKGNPQPRFLFRGVEVVDVRELRGDPTHLKVMVRDPHAPAGQPLPVLWWRHGCVAPHCWIGQRLDIAGSLEVSEFRGTFSPQIIAHSMRDHATRLVLGAEALPMQRQADEAPAGCADSSAGGA